MRCWPTWATSRPSFQSTPPVTEGRCQEVGGPLGDGFQRFNPRPPSPRGDAFEPMLAKLRELVSIHAPRHRGAMRRRSARRHGADRRFNPRPPSPRGDAFESGEDFGENLFQSTPPVTEGRCLSHPRQRRPRSVVSIHAPRHRGAMLLALHQLVELEAFQSTPPVTEGRCALLTAAVSSTIWFQSTPPVTEGRCSPPSSTRSATGDGFNPRPPSPRGDALVVLADHVAVVLFQSTPPVTEGRCPAVRFIRMTLKPFQSTPPVTEGRCFSLASRMSGSALFQSTPPVTEGRCSAMRHTPFADHEFQSTPPVTEGRCLAGGFDDGCGCHVSIHAPRCHCRM